MQITGLFRGAFCNCNLQANFGELSRFAASNCSLSFSLLLAIAICKACLPYFLQFLAIANYRAFSGCSWQFASFCKYFSGNFQNYELSLFPATFCNFNLQALFGLLFAIASNCKLQGFFRVFFALASFCTILPTLSLSLALFCSLLHLITPYSIHGHLLTPLRPRACTTKTPEQKKEDK